jgi:hypothetical protein
MAGFFKWTEEKKGNYGERSNLRGIILLRPMLTEALRTRIQTSIDYFDNNNFAKKEWLFAGNSWME